MSTLPIAQSWDDVKPGVESVAGKKLIGWRTGPIVDAGFVTPFVLSDVIGTECSLPIWGRGEDQLHDGQRVHPGCTCGTNCTRTREQAIQYLRHAQDNGSAVAQGNGYVALGVEFHGYALCKVSVREGWHVTGPAQRPEVHPVDPEWCARSERLALEEIQVPANVPARVVNKIQRRFEPRHIPVVLLTFTLKGLFAEAA